jgi:fatty acid desaturase
MNNNGGTPLATLLTVAFVVLKLTGVITWSWFWVLSPIPITLGLIFLFLTVFILFGIYTGRGRITKRK